MPNFNVKASPTYVTTCEFCITTEQQVVVSRLGYSDLGQMGSESPSISNVSWNSISTLAALTNLQASCDLLEHQ